MSGPERFDQILLGRIAKHVRLAGSANDNEALAALRSLQRVLAAAGLSLNDLGDHLEQAPRLAVFPKPSDGDRKVDPMLANHILIHFEDQLSAWEKWFLTDVAAWRGKLSSKQRDCLSGIWRRLNEPDQPFVYRPSWRRRHG